MYKIVGTRIPHRNTIMDTSTIMRNPLPEYTCTCMSREVMADCASILDSNACYFAGIHNINPLTAARSF